MINKEFFAGRNIPDLHPESLAYQQYWDVQWERCVSGLEINGFKMTGNAYFYFNFYKMEDAVTNEIILPNFSYKDNDFFSYLDHCERKGLGLFVITARGEGKSNKVASAVCNCFTTNQVSLSFLTASLDPHLNKLFKKVQTGLNNVPDALFINKLTNSLTEYRIESGMKYLDEQKREKVKNEGRKIEGIVFGNDAGKARGGRPTYVVYEEVGSWSGKAKLKECRSAMNASLSIGMHTTGTPIYIGTGGEMETGGSEDAKDMFYNPNDYKLMMFDEFSTKPTAYFIPAYEKFGGFYEKQGQVIAKEEHEIYGYQVGEVIGDITEDGLNDSQGAKRFLEAKRKTLEKNQKEYEKEIQEYPFTPQEAFLTSGSTPFSFVKSRVYQLSIDSDYNNLIQIGDLIDTGKLADDGFPIIEFIPNPKGNIQILEHPEWVVNPEIKPKSLLYISGCDSYDQDQAKGSKNPSNGSIFVSKRFSGVNTTSNLFVCQYTHRPQFPKEFFYNTYLINCYYRSKMLVEHTKIAILEYYQRNNYQRLLWERPNFIYADMKYTKAQYKYGLQMPEQVKDALIGIYQSWLHENLNNMYFLDQLEDHQNFVNGDSRFDRTIASMLCIAQNTEMGNTAPKDTNPLDDKRNLKPKWKLIKGQWILD